MEIWKLSGLLKACGWLWICVPMVYSDPLTVHPTNPRYFSDGSGKAILLTGSHTWNNLGQQRSRNFDKGEYLDVLEKNNHNFIRMWPSSFLREYLPPYPYERTGPGTAVDGEPKLDLNKFNQAYFDLLRSRVIAARDKGMYVGIIVFPEGGKKNEDWDNHFFNARNNINGTKGDPNGDGIGLEVQTMGDPAITAFQEALARKTIDTVNDLDNVLYEIINEEPSHSTDWQYHMIRFIKNYEASKPKQHPVGMTFQTPDGTNETLLKSPADWISPGPSGRPWETPGTADGTKIVISDTDHYNPVLVDPKWAWKTFLRGNNPILMDWWKDPVGLQQGPVREAMGYVRTYAEKINLAKMIPQNGLASTGFCLAYKTSSEGEYLVYLPDGGSVTVDLSSSQGEFFVEWFNAGSGNIVDGGKVDGGSNRSFKAPFGGHAALYIFEKSGAK